MTVSGAAHPTNAGTTNEQARTRRSRTDCRGTNENAQCTGAIWTTWAQSKRDADFQAGTRYPYF